MAEYCYLTYTERAYLTSLLCVCLYKCWWSKATICFWSFPAPCSLVGTVRPLDWPLFLHVVVSGGGTCHGGLLKETDYTAHDHQVRLSFSIQFTLSSPLISSFFLCFCLTVTSFKDTALCLHIYVLQCMLLVWFSTVSCVCFFSWVMTGNT